jgi:predicted PurR-regulated permease PerM
MAERPEVKVPFVVALLGAWGWRIVAGTAALAILYFALVQLYVVVVPVVLALFVASVLEPLASRLRQRGMPPSIAAVIVFVGALAVLGGVFAWIGSSVANQFSDVGRQVDDATREIQDWLKDGPLNLSTERIEELREGIGNLLSSGGGEGSGVAAGALKGARTATEVFGGIVLLLFTVFFLIKDGERMGAWFRLRIPPGYLEDAEVVTRRARYIMQKYLVATALTGLIDAVLIGVALAILGVPLVLPLAVLTFIGGFFPIVGATLAGLVAALVALVDGGVATALAVVAVTIGVQQIEGNVLQPFILERAVKLHALVTVWAVGAGLVIGGLLGAYLAVPLVALAVNVASFYRWRESGGHPPGEEEPEPEPQPVTPDRDNGD